MWEFIGDMPKTSFGWKHYMYSVLRIKQLILLFKKLSSSVGDVGFYSIQDAGFD